MAAGLKNLQVCKKCGQRASGNVAAEVAAALKRHDCKKKVKQ